MEPFTFKMIRFFCERFLRSCCFAFCFLSFSVAAQQWYQAPTIPFHRNINSIQLLTPETLILGGGSESNDSIQTIYLSHDKGLLWDAADNIGTPPWIKSLAFIDSVKGIAVGYTSTLFKTVDGAARWYVIHPPVNRQLNKVIYVNANTLFIAGGSVPRSDTIQTILKSIDSGNTWTVSRDTAGYWLKGITFTDANNGVAVGDHGTILRTTDGGATWNKITSPVDRDWFSVKFINASTGYITGGKEEPDSIGTLLLTNNGGISWSVVKDDSLGYLTDITFTNSTTGYIVGARGRVLKTTNGGANWNAVVLPDAQADMHFNSVNFKNDSLGIIAGNDGIIYVYTFSSLPAVTTLQANYLDTAMSKMSGSINSHGEHASYNFYYSSDSTFSSYFRSLYIDGEVRNNISELVQASTYTLTPDTTYYYYLLARTLAGETSGDTLSFTAGKPHYTFQTGNATNVIFTNATLHGSIDKFPGLVALSFEYGTTANFGNAITAAPSSVNDTFFHAISANISSLLPNKIYYYRLKGIYNSKLYYGDIKLLFTGKTYETAETKPATVTSTDATLNAFIDKWRVPVQISFDYGTASFDTFISIGTITDSFAHTISYTLHNLVPGQYYSFRIHAISSFDTVFGAALHFYSGLGFDTLNTSAAIRIDSTTEQVRGIVSNLSAPVTVSFEYGTTLSLGNTMAAIPSAISDTATYSIKANLTGLASGQKYFYRLKVSTAAASYYGEIKQFYSGFPEIPNWDFQLWQTDTVQLPKYWNIYLDGFERVAGHSGNYAIRVFGQNVLTNGVIGDKFYGGIPWTGTRPDSVVLYASYSIAAGDSAGMLVMLKTNGNVTDTGMYAFTGSSGGNFQRISFPINYVTALTPDSIIIAIIPSVHLGAAIPSNNTVTIDDISFLPGNTGFANSNFEDWIPAYVDSPIDWFYFKYILPDTLDPRGNRMVSKAYFDPPADFAAEIRSFYIPILGGYASGDLSTTSNVFIDHIPDFPVLGRHSSLNGFFKFLPDASGDTMQVRIQMFKNGVDIGDGEFSYGDSTPQFIPFSVPINYMDSIVVPDSAKIHLRSSKNTAKQNTRLFVDKLSFDGFVSVNVKNEILELDGMKVYPNPARDILMIENLPGDKACSLSLMTITGRSVREINLGIHQHNAQLWVGDLDAGFYILVMKKGDNIFSRKIVIQRN